MQTLEEIPTKDSNVLNFFGAFARRSPHLEAVVDPDDTGDGPQCFLRHLFEEEAVDRSLKSNPFVSFDGRDES